MNGVAASSWSMCFSTCVVNMYSLVKGDLHLLISNYAALTFSSFILISIVAVLIQVFGGRTKNAIPGNLGMPYVGETFAFLTAANSAKGCYDFVRQRRLRYGNWFKTRILGKIHVFAPTPEAAKMVFANEFVVFNKGYLKSMADAVGRKSLLTAPHEVHKRIRRLLSYTFSMNSMSKFVGKFDQELSERLKRLEMEGKSFRVLEFTMKVAFDGICDILMSITDTELQQRLETDISAVADAMLSFPVMIPGTQYYRGMKARKRVMETFKAIIAKRRRENHEATGDFLQSMIQRDSYPPDEKLDDEEILDNLLTLVIAGQSTTAAAIMWCVKLLDENKGAQERLREEQVLILRKKPAGELLKYEDLMSMSYSSKVVKETLRMANVLLWYPRVASADCVIEGYEIKKGWNVNVDATHIHYDPATYDQPLRFNPSRFNEIQKPYTYIPFGCGPRTCLGINMVKVTMLVFLHRLTTGYIWSVDDDDPSLERKAHIPRLQSGCPITLTRRTNTYDQI